MARLARDVRENALLDVSRMRSLTYALVVLHLIGLTIVALDASALSFSETMIRGVIYGACLGGVHAGNDVRLTVFPDVIVVRNPLLVRRFSEDLVTSVGLRQGAVLVRVRGWPLGFLASATSGALQFGSAARADRLLGQFRSAGARMTPPQPGQSVLSWRFRLSWIPLVTGGAAVYCVLALIAEAIFN